MSLEGVASSMESKQKLIQKTNAKSPPSNMGNLWGKTMNTWHYRPAARAAYGSENTATQSLKWRVLSTAGKNRMIWKDARVRLKTDP